MRIFQGILTVDQFLATGTLGEYSISSGLFRSETDPTFEGAFSIVPGMVVYVQSADVATADPLPGVGHRFLITSATPLSEDRVDLTIHWAEDGDEVDVPLNQSVALLSEATPNRSYGLPPSPWVYDRIPSGLWEAAILADIRAISDHNTGGGSAEHWRMRRGL